MRNRVSYCIVYSCLTVLITLFSGAISLADEPDKEYLTVVTQALNVRIGPGAYTPVLTQIYRGDRVEVIEKDNNSGWWLIRLANGEPGWISGGSAYVSPSQQTVGNTSASSTSISSAPSKDSSSITTKGESPDTFDKQRLLIVAPGLNARIGPGVHTPIVTQLHQGQVLEVANQDRQNGWWLIHLPNDETAWVSGGAAYVKPFDYDSYVPLTPPPKHGLIIMQTASGGPIYAVNPDGSNLRYLTTGVDPILSPDGTKLAYTSYSGISGGTYPSEIGTLWIYDLATGEKQAIMGDIYEPKSPSWSPDGQEIVLSYQNGGRQQVEERCYDNDDGIDLPDPAVIFDVDFDADGSVCFKLFPDTHWMLRKVSVETGQFQDLPSERYSFAPTWDPANPWRIVFFTHKNGLLQLDLNRGVYFPFFENSYTQAPVFSPNGHKVAVSYKQHEHWEVYTIDVATGQLNRLTKSEPMLHKAFNSAAPAWSPDGTQIIFLSDRSGQWQPWIMNDDGSRPHPLFPSETVAGLEFAYHGVHERLFSWR